MDPAVAATPSAICVCIQRSNSRPAHLEKSDVRHDGCNDANDFRIAVKQIAPVLPEYQADGADSKC